MLAPGCYSSAGLEFDSITSMSLQRRLAAQIADYEYSVDIEAGPSPIGSSPSSRTDEAIVVIRDNRRNLKWEFRRELDPRGSEEALARDRSTLPGLPPQLATMEEENVDQSVDEVEVEFVEEPESGHKETKTLPSKPKAVAKKIPQSMKHKFDTKEELEEHVRYVKLKKARAARFNLPTQRNDGGSSSSGNTASWRRQ